MNLLGKVQPTKFKNRKYWIVEIDPLGILASGKSRNYATLKALDNVEAVVNKKGFKVTAEFFGKNVISISTSNPILLRQHLKMKSKVTSEEFYQRFDERENVSDLGDEFFYSWLR